MADFAIFNSGPKKIVTNMFYFNLERGQVMGCKQPMIEEDEDLLGLDNWIRDYCPSKIPLIAGKLMVSQPAAKLQNEERSETSKTICRSIWHTEREMGNILYR